MHSALPLLAWSRIWSPIVPDDLREEAWSALALPDTYAELSAEYWSTFHVGNPLPSVPLLMHAALQREGGAVREDWMRVAQALALEWNDAHLSPDQLGAACEVYAVAIEREEPMLIEELRSRYLLPWCQVAKARLESRAPHLAFLPRRFEADLLAI
jgi:TorA maturation chaperone TorD